MGGFGGSRSAPPPPPPPPAPEPVDPNAEARRRAAVSRSRRAGRPLLGPGGAQRDDELQTTLGAG